MRRLLLSFLFLCAISCGDDVKKSASNSSANGDPNASNMDAGTPTDSGNNANPDMGGTDGGVDMEVAPTCEDEILNQDESDVDCGGGCAPCTNGEACNAGIDCESTFCSPQGVCDVAPFQTGEECSAGTDCASGRCEEFGGVMICTEACTDTCPGQNLACFRNQCVPNDYCDDPDGDGFGFGPGCDGQPCDRCAADATCSEQGDGTFVCMCNSGFVGDGTTCADVDECASGANNCDANASCTNEVGSFSCTCNAGFAGDGESCADVDECSDGIDNCDVNASCTNLAGSFSCACDQGFVGDGVTCTDVDECASGSATCDSNASCTNIPGAFTCACDSGFTGNGFTCADVDECAAGTDNCAAGAICTNTPGGFSCGCQPGYTGDGVTCTDVNECSTGAANCATNATCTNSPGSFMCTCNAGYSGDGSTCVDINECALGTDSCGANSRCVNLPATHTCICESGYEGDAFAGCTNVDECTNGTDNCDPNADCFDVPGNYACTCQSGYSGNGFVCADVDECAAGTDNCSSNAACTNTAGGFACACDAGYVGDGVTCELIGDTCATALPIASVPFSTSNDTSLAQDDYAYGDNQCPGDTTGNGAMITDLVYTFTPTTTGTYLINSSATYSERIYVVTDCSSIGTSCLGATFTPPLSVSLTAGTQYFIIVDGGFTGDEGPFDLDLYEDECANSNPCDPVASCTSTPAGAQCTCPTGYSGDGFSCVDDNECTDGTNNCDANASCTNTPGSFTCSCNAGFSGDGVVCWDPSALGESCSNPIPLSAPAFPASFSGDTTPMFNDLSHPDGACVGGASTLGRGAGSADEVWSYTPTVTATYEFAVTADHSTAFYIVTDCSDIANQCVAGNYDFGGTLTSFTLTTTLTAGTQYFFVVDGASNFSNNVGTYSILMNQL